MALLDSRPDQMNLSFSGCGFLCVYHAGVAVAIKEYAPEFLENKILGASAGSIVACGLITNVCISEATTTILKVVTQARSNVVGPLHPDFNLLGIVREELERVLPPNAYVMCTGRLVISLTRWSDHENVTVDEYSSNSDLIDAIMCSCFIPLYCGITPPKYRGVQYIDGGVSDNQPIYDEHTITVSPFAGESDICPNDWDSGSILGVDFNGTSIRFTARNMFRLMACLWPRSNEDLSRMCLQGFEDALRFLTKRQLAPCIRCLTIQTAEVANSVTEGRRAPSECFSENDDARTVAPPPPVRIRKRASSNQLNSYRTRVESECETCGDSDIPLEEANIQSFFPSIMRKPFEDAVAAERSVFQYVMSFRVFRYARNAFGISKFPLDMALALVKKLVYTTAERAFLTAFFGRLHQYVAMVGVPQWVQMKLSALADFILGEVEKQKGRFTNFTCLVAVSETGNYGACLASTSQDNQEKEIEMSEDAKKELKMLQERDRRRKMMKKAGKLTPDRSEESLPSTDMYDVDSYEHVINFTRNHEALYEFHYMDENHVRRSVGLFTDHHASSNGGSSTSSHHQHSRSIGCPSRLRHVPEEDEDVASAVSAPGVLFRGGLVESDDKDSGLSGIDSLRREETAEENCQEAAPSKRDACCSPVHEFDATTVIVDDNQPSTSGAPPASVPPQGFQESATFPRRTRGRRFAHLKKTSAASSTPAIMSSDSEGIDGTEKLFVPSRKAWRASSEKDPAGTAPATMNNDHTTA